VVATSSRLSDLRPTAVNAILAEVRELQARGQSLVSLMRGEPDLATPTHIVEACTRALKTGRTSYPDNRGELNFREAVAEKLRRDNALQYHPGTEILATTGATFGIYAALGALLNEGDEVLLPDPVYDAYQSPIRLCGGRVRSVTSKIEGLRFVITEAALEAAWSPAARVLILNTPWNPVGTVLTRAEIEVVARFCERRNLILLSDEIYESITYGDAQHVSPPAAARSLRERCVLVNSLSKTYAMTGWRVGYCAAPAPIIQAMFMVLAQSSRGPATFIQDAAAEALAGPQQCVADMRAEYTKRQEQVMTALSGIPGVTVLPPEGGFFAMLDVRGIALSSNEIRVRLMRQHDVVVVHGAAYGPGGEGTLRVSFASGGTKLTNGLAALRSGLIQIRESIK
jgi:aspartate aminotransferase